MVLHIVIAIRIYLVILSSLASKFIILLEKNVFGENKVVWIDINQIYKYLYNKTIKHKCIRDICSFIVHNGIF